MLAKSLNSPCAKARPSVPEDGGANLRLTELVEVVLPRTAIERQRVLHPREVGVEPVTRRHHAPQSQIPDRNLLLRSADQPLTRAAAWPTAHETTTGCDLRDHRPSPSLLLGVASHASVITLPGLHRPMASPAPSVRLTGRLLSRPAPLLLNTTLRYSPS